MRVRSLAAVGTLFAASTIAGADVTLVGTGTVPGTTKDKSGLKGIASDGTPLDTLGGHGSAIASTATPGVYVLASDRGPKDGTVAFPARMHSLKIEVKPGEKKPISIELLSTTLLKDENGKSFDGSADAFQHSEAEKNLRLDIEGVRVVGNGHVFVSDEYGPVIYEFDTKGKRVRSLKVPARYRIAKPSKTAADELPPKTTSGRQPNRGLECLAISPDGSKLYGLMQGPLIQDHGVNEKLERTGKNCRILEIDLKTEATREFVYHLEHANHGNSEIVAVNDHEFLVLERDSLGGKDAKAKQVFHIDITSATDVSTVEVLPQKDLPKTITPVKKKLFLDLLDKKYGIQDADLPEKFEGLAFGTDLADGRHLLLVTADNDFVATKPFRVYAFAIDPADLPKYTPQVFGKK
jgi:hypothetical protein